MTTHHLLRPVALACLATLAAGPSFAQSGAQEGGYWYGGAGIGTSRAKLNEEAITNSVLGGGIATSISRDSRATAGKLFFGYQLNRNLGVEAGYFDLGKYGFTSTLPAGTLEGRLGVRGVNLDLVGTLPLTENLSAIARIGAQNAKTTGTYAASPGLGVVAPTRSERFTNAKAGLGLQYALSPSFLVRGEAERYRINDGVGQHANVNVVSVSLVMPFGRSAAPAPRAMAAPVVMAQAPAPMPAPEPVMAPPPPPPVVVTPAPPPPAPVPAPPQRVSFSAESLFSFDASVIHPEGMAALDGFAKNLDTTRYDSITVEGHTDRLGSAAYNQTLSQQRAEAVKSYLVVNGHLDPARISAVGRSESMPVTKPEDCVGSKANARLILCLQPDRRVDVEVTGSR